MKKIKLAGLLIATACLALFTGCGDLQLREYLESKSKNVEVAELPFDVSEDITPALQLSPLPIGNRGFSISFFLQLEKAVTDNTYEWESPIKLSSAALGDVYIDVGPLGIYPAGGKGANFFEGDATLNPDYDMTSYGWTEAWNIFCFDGEKYYMTVSFNEDNSITYYKNGELVFTFDADLSKEGVKVSTGGEIAKKIAKDSGVILAATLDDEEFAMEKVHIDFDCDDAKAKSLFDEASK